MKMDLKGRTFESVDPFSRVCCSEMVKSRSLCFFTVDGIEIFSRILDYSSIIFILVWKVVKGKGISEIGFCAGDVMVYVGFSTCFFC